MVPLGVQNTTVLRTCLFFTQKYCGFVSFYTTILRTCLFFRQQQQGRDTSFYKTVLQRCLSFRQQNQGYVSFYTTILRTCLFFDSSTRDTSLFTKQYCRHVSLLDSSTRDMSIFTQQYCGHVSFLHAILRTHIFLYSIIADLSIFNQKYCGKVSFYTAVQRKHLFIQQYSGFVYFYPEVLPKCLFLHRCIADTSFFIQQYCGPDSLQTAAIQPFCMTEVFLLHMGTTELEMTEQKTTGQISASSQSSIAARKDVLACGRLTSSPPLPPPLHALAHYRPPLYPIPIPIGAVCG